MMEGLSKLEPKFIPQKLAQRCPVCNGYGTLKYGSKTCQACEGKGYVLVPAAQREGEKEHGLDQAG